ncbi:MAG: Fis family transcriptional regulator [Acidobacteria bacterium]|nr:MAG: Fis family transcriptional regulator [Acidobacteriota bacterium]
MEAARYDVIVTDIKMPKIDGIEVLKHAHRLSPESAVVLITAAGDFDSAVQAVKAGAFDYIQKTPNALVEEVRVSIGRAAEVIELRRQNQAFRRDAASRNSMDNIIGCSPAINTLKETIRTVASTGSTILIQGESGTGKELVARAVHSCSQRDGQPFVSVNCGAFPETLLETELFGYMKGAFTGANQNKQGLFEVASGGTIFLDEIAEMSLAMQVKLLRALQERTIRPVGGTSEIPVDVRVIAATNRDLQEMVEQKTFREDLYYRITVIPIEVPPLRARQEDIPLLANHFLKRYAPAAGKNILRISDESIEMLMAYDWPGNVRQLENTIERGVAMEIGEVLNVIAPGERSKARVAAEAMGALSPESVAVPADGIDMEAYVADLERSMLQSALRQSGGVQTRAAEMLKLSYRSFRHLMKKYNL